MLNNENNRNGGTGQHPIQRNLEDQFGQLQRAEEVPEHLKQEVFNTLDTLHLLADLTDLFTVKFSSTEAEFLDLFESEDFSPPPSQGLSPSQDEE